MGASRALAFTALCRFAHRWSDRPTTLALPAVAIYEHLGRHPAENAQHAEQATVELTTLFADTQLPIAPLEFGEGRTLVDVLRDVHSDAQLLTCLAQGVHARYRRPGLSANAAPIPGDRLPPDALAFRYFHPGCVKLAFAARIDAEAVEQAQFGPQTRAIGSGELSDLLNRVSNRKRLLVGGRLHGLADIELLQRCQLAVQHRHPHEAVMLGQTFDESLASLLGKSASLAVNAALASSRDGIEAVESRLQDITERRRVFTVEAERADRIRPMARSFVRALTDACLQARGPFA